MEELTDSLKKLPQEFIIVCVRDPHTHRDDFWHKHLDYEISIHTNSMCFRMKNSCVRRRYSEFVWLRQRLQDNALLIDLPKLPPWNPFFSQTNSCQVTERMKGLQKFLEGVLNSPLLLSDSRLHLFLQSQLSVMKIEACAQGHTRYSVAEAIHSGRCDTPPVPSEDEESKASCDSDCDSTTSSGCHSMEPAASGCDEPYCNTPFRAALLR